MSEHVRVERSGGVLAITLARPERRNAITVDMYAALADAIAGAFEDGETRVITIRGEGQDFAAGNDLADFLAARREPTRKSRSGGCCGRWPSAKSRSSPRFMAIASGSARPCCCIATW